jgi:membrane-bound ClpP family serine protease
MDKSNDAKTNITDKLYQIYNNTFSSKTIETDSFEGNLMKRLKFFKKKLENKNKTNKKGSVLGKMKGQVKKTIKNLKEKGKKLLLKKSKNVPPNN